MMLTAYLVASLALSAEPSPPPCELNYDLARALEQNKIQSVLWKAMDRAKCLENRGSDAEAAALFLKMVQATEHDSVNQHWHVSAQIHLGLLYAQGKKKDLVQAQQILDSVRESGAANPGENLRDLGTLMDVVADHLWRGDGLPQHREKAIRRFRESYNLTRSEKAALTLGEIWAVDAQAGKKPWNEALEWLGKGGPAGHLLAATYLLEGRPGLGADRKKALEAFKRAASDHGVLHQVYPGWHEARREASLLLGRLLAPEPAHTMEAIRYLHQAGKAGQPDLIKLLAALPYRLAQENFDGSEKGAWKVVSSNTSKEESHLPEWLDGDLLATQIWGRMPDPSQPNQGPKFEDGRLLLLQHATPDQWLLVSGDSENMAVALLSINDQARTVRILARSIHFSFAAPTCICGQKGCDHFEGQVFGHFDVAEQKAQAGSRRLIALETYAMAGYAGGGASFSGWLLLDVQDGEIAPLIHLPAAYELDLRGERTPDGTWGHYEERAAWRLRLAPGPRAMPDLILTSKKKGPGATYLWNKATGAYVRSR